MENRILFALFVILRLFVATSSAKCGAMRLKLSKHQCAPKIGNEDKVQPCINLCTKKLVPVKQCSKQPHCCIHNCACVMKGAGSVNLPKQFWPAKTSEFKLVDGCAPTTTDSENEDQKIKDEKNTYNSQKQVKSQNRSSPAMRRTPRHRFPRKPVSTVSKLSRPTRSSKTVKPQKRAGKPTGKTFARTTSKKPRPRPTKPSNPLATKTKKPCKKPSPFMNLFASRFSSFLSGMGFVVSNNNKPC